MHPNLRKLSSRPAHLRVDGRRLFSAGAHANALSPRSPSSSMATKLATARSPRQCGRCW